MNSSLNASLDSSLRWYEWFLNWVRRLFPPWIWAFVKRLFESILEKFNPYSFSFRSGQSSSINSNLGSRSGSSQDSFIDSGLNSNMS